MNVKQSLDFLNDLGISNIKLGLDNIKKNLKVLGNPEKSYKAVHIAGTNGKGSVCRMIYDILSVHGIKSGLYTSPHLISPCERIVCNVDKHDKISEKEFVFLLTKIKNACNNLNIELTYFEYLTCLAFLYFKEKNIEYAVVETGLGGRLDATNVLEDKVCVITNISYDHMNYLGNSLDEIAKEKFGIIKEGNSVISNQCSVIRGDLVISNKCSVFSQELNVRNIKFIETGIYFDFVYFDFKINNIFIPCLGEYQIDNAALAIITAIEILKEKIDKSLIKEALSSFSWPGRMETVKIGNKTIIFEGAHNNAGMEYFADFLEKQKEKPLIVLGILKDKDYINMIKIIASQAESIVINSSFHENAVPGEKMYQECLKYCKNIQIIENLEELGGFILQYKNNYICVTGSLYLIGKIILVIK